MGDLKNAFEGGFDAGVDRGYDMCGKGGPSLPVDEAWLLYKKEQMIETDVAGWLPADGERCLAFIPPREEQPDDAGTAMATSSSGSFADWMAARSGWLTAWREGDRWFTGIRGQIEGYAEIDAPAEVYPLPGPPQLDA